MKTVLITGGAGFIGVNTADYFLERGWVAIVVDDFSRQGSELNAKWLKSRHGFVRLTLARVGLHDVGRLAELIAAADLVIHCAAQVAVTSSVSDPMHDFEINAKGTLNILEAARKSLKKPVVIYTSTNKVYGGLEGTQVIERETRYSFDGLPLGVSEKQNLDFHSPYGCSKGAADQYTRDYFRIYGLPTIVFRNSCIYGQHQFGNTDQGWLSFFAKSALTRQPIIIYGDGKQVRDALYVRDLAEAFRSAFEHREVTAGQIYNMGGGVTRSVSIIELMAILEDLTGYKLAHSFADWRPGDQKVYISDIGKAGRDFGWSPKVSLNDGLREMLEWLKNS